MRIIYYIVLLFILASCAPPEPPKPKPNALQIEAMQTAEFTASKRETFNAVMTVLQNEGYMIQAASYDTGFITAKSATKAVKTAPGPSHMAFSMGMGSGAFWGGPTFVEGPPVNVTYAVTVTAFVTPVTKATHVRLNFVQNEVVGGIGNTSEDVQVLDTEIYKKSFNGIRQQLFVKQGIENKK